MLVAHWNALKLTLLRNDLALIRAGVPGRKHHSIVRIGANWDSDFPFECVASGVTHSRRPENGWRSLEMGGGQSRDFSCLTLSKNYCTGMIIWVHRDHCTGTIIWVYYDRRCRMLKLVFISLDNRDRFTSHLPHRSFLKPP